jgi:hypothetical protein
MTIKMIYLAKRNPVLAPHEFAPAWKSHSALGAQCTNVRDKVISVRQCARVLTHRVPAGFSSDYDGVNLLTVKSLEAAHSIWTDPETLAIMRPDEPRVFSSYVREFTLVAQEAWAGEPEASIRHQPGGRCVVLGFLQGDRLQDLSHDAVAVSLPGAESLVLNLVCEQPPEGYDYSVILEAWYASATQALASFGQTSLVDSPLGALSGRLDRSRSVWMLTQVTHHRP